MKNRQLPGSLFTINSFKCDSSNSRSVSLISRIPQHKAFNDCKTWLGWIIAGFGPLAAEVFAADFNDFVKCSSYDTPKKGLVEK